MNIADNDRGYGERVMTSLGLGPILGSQPVWGIRPMGPTRGKEVKQLAF